MNTSLIFVMVAIAIGGVAWVFIYPLLSGERNAERRMASVTRKEPMQQRTPRAGQKSRREQVEGTRSNWKRARRRPRPLRPSGQRRTGKLFSQRRPTFYCVRYGGAIVEHAAFVSIYNPGKIALLVGWKDVEAAK